MLDKQNKSPETFQERGKEFRFNDHVVIEAIFGLPDSKRSGRLVQIRKGCGQFGSNVYLLRLSDGSLMSFENVLIRHAHDKQFVDAYYLMNNMVPPSVTPQACNPLDSETATYTLSGKWPETGFIIENPAQPPTPGSFSIAVVAPRNPSLNQTEPS